MWHIIYIFTFWKSCRTLICGGRGGGCLVSVYRDTFTFLPCSKEVCDTQCNLGHTMQFSVFCSKLWKFPIKLDTVPPFHNPWTRQFLQNIKLPHKTSLVECVNCYEFIDTLGVVALYCNKLVIKMSDFKYPHINSRVTHCAAGRGHYCPIRPRLVPSTLTQSVLRSDALWSNIKKQDIFVSRLLPVPFHITIPPLSLYLLHLRSFLLLCFILLLFLLRFHYVFRLNSPRVRLILIFWSSYLFLSSVQDLTGLLTTYREFHSEPRHPPTLNTFLYETFSTFIYVPFRLIFTLPPLHGCYTSLV